MTDDNLKVKQAYELGGVSAEVEGLKREMHEVKNDVRLILSTLNQAKGGWRTLVMIAGVAGMFGALAAKLSTIFPFLVGRGGP